MCLVRLRLHRLSDDILFSVWRHQFTLVLNSTTMANGRYTYVASALCLTLIAIVVPTISGQFSDKLSAAQNPCVSKVTCSDCIQTKSCAWCLEPDFGDRPRCFQPSLSAITGSCPEQYTWNPDHEERILIHEELTRAGKAAGGGVHVSGSEYSASSSSSSSSSHSSSAHFGSSSRGSASSSSKITQIYPQRVGLKLRISMCGICCCI